MLGDAFDDMPQISLRIEPVQFSRADEAVDCGGSLTARVRTGEEKVFSPEGPCSQRAFRCIVFDFDGAGGDKTPPSAPGDAPPCDPVSTPTTLPPVPSFPRPGHHARRSPAVPVWWCRGRGTTPAPGYRRRAASRLPAHASATHRPASAAVRWI